MKKPQSGKAGRQSNKAGQQEAQQVFRQFAWLLAGTLASRKRTARPRRKSGTAG